MENKNQKHKTNFFLNKHLVHLVGDEKMRGDQIDFNQKKKKNGWGVKK